MKDYRKPEKLSDKDKPHKDQKSPTNNTCTILRDKTTSERRPSLKKRVSFHSDVDFREYADEEKKEDTPSSMACTSARTSKYPQINGRNASLFDVKPDLVPLEVCSMQNKTTTPSAINQKMVEKTPLVYWKEGLSKKVSVFSLSNWAALSLTLDGRDKITKTLQYLCRLLVWWYGRGNNKSRALPFNNLYKSLGTSRKAFRLGRFLIEFQKLKEMLTQMWNGAVTTVPRPLTTSFRMLDSFSSFSLNNTSKNNGSASLTTPLWKSFGVSCKLVGLAGFWLGDNISYLSQTGFLSDRFVKDRTKAPIFATRSYFFAALVGWYINYKELRLHRKRLQDAIDNVYDLVEEQEEFSSDNEDETSGKNTAVSKEKSGLRNELNVAIAKLRDEKAKQFVLFLALLKASLPVSRCKSIYFSSCSLAATPCPPPTHR
jgi:hypothetical protein